MTQTQTQTQALAVATPVAIVAGYTRDQIDLLKRTIARGTTDDEFALFMATANRMQLDPFAKQIHAVKRYSKREQREVMAIQVGIDGYRAGAMRTGDVDGQEGPHWCGEDGVWRDVWLHDAPPAAARVIVYRKGCSKPFAGIATYRSYVQTTQSGEPNQQWQRGPDFMLAKCAEALALRKAFPAELGGTHAPEEAGNDDERSDLAALPSGAVVAVGSSTANDRRDAGPTDKPATATDTVKTTKQEVPAAADIEAIGLEMASAPDERELGKIGARIGKLQMTKEQREGLLKIFTFCRDELRKKASAK